MDELTRTQADRRAPTKQSWHLKKEINVSLIISVVLIAISFVLAFADLKRDVALIQADLVVLHNKDTELYVTDAANTQAIRTQYERLESKLDRLIERSTK